MAKYRYPGAQPFSTSQEHIFFGRNKDINALYRSIRLEPLVVLHSKSGLGKSSLMNAGLVPQVIKDGKYQPVKIRFNAYNQHSDTIQLPLEATRTAVAKANESTDKTTFIEKLLPEENSLWYMVKREQAYNPNRQLMLLFDQFEELFTYPEQAITEFKKELAEVLHTQIPQRFREIVEQEVENPTLLTLEQLALIHQAFKPRIVFAIRSDRISLLDKIADYLPDVKRSWYELEALQQEQAEDAILNPAYKKGEFASPIFDYEDATIEKILGFLTRENTQKIESFQLQILCQAIERKVIQQQLTLVTEADLGNIEEVYENYYEDQIKLIEDPDEQLAARRFIEEGLIFEEEERRLSLYEGQIFSQYGISESLLSKLEDTHLIRRQSSMKGGYTYELSHDTLVAPVLKAKEQRLAEERLVQEKTERQRREKELADARSKAEEERQLREEAEQSTRKAKFRTRLALGALLLALIFGTMAYFSGKHAARKTVEAQNAFTDLKKKNEEVVRLILKNANTDVLNLRYEEALKKIDAAARIDALNPEVANAYLEIAFWYGETGKSDRARNLLDSAATLVNKTAQNLQPFREAIKAVDPLVFDTLMKRYYPIMVSVDGGIFDMGGGKYQGDNKHQQEVSSFEIAKYETTWYQYRLFCEATGHKFTTESFSEGEHPVVNVSWFDAILYLNWTSKQFGLDTFYIVENQIQENQKVDFEVSLNTAANGFRLPTEAEWEYAARSKGKDQIWAGTSDESELRSFANYGGVDVEGRDVYKRTGPVGSFEANDLGLYDMSGNVNEWCWDYWHADEYLDNPSPNYYRPSESYRRRVHRGGSWNGTIDHLRCRNSYPSFPISSSIHIGFRPARAAH